MCLFHRSARPSHSPSSDHSLSFFSCLRNFPRFAHQLPSARQFFVTKTLTLTFTAAVLVEADDESAAIVAAGESEGLISEPSYTLPADSTDLDEQWSLDLDEDFEAEEVEEVNSGDPCAECGVPIESADQIADGRPLCADHFAHWNNMTA